MEPERKIEKWLRAYLKKRRGQSGGPFELHPATRRLLQGEVARNAPKEGRDDSPSLWRLFHRRWAFLAGFAICIFLGAALFFHSLSTANKPAEMSSLGISQHTLSEFDNAKKFEEQTNSLDENTLAMNNNSAAPQPLRAEIPETEKNPAVNRNAMNAQPAPVQPPSPALTVSTGELAPAPSAVAPPPPAPASEEYAATTPATVPPATLAPTPMEPEGGQPVLSDNVTGSIAAKTNTQTSPLMTRETMNAQGVQTTTASPPASLGGGYAARPVTLSTVPASTPAASPAPRSGGFWASVGGFFKGLASIPFGASTIPASTSPATYEMAGAWQQNSIPAGTSQLPAASNVPAGGQPYAAAQPTVSQNAFTNTFTPSQNTSVLANFTVQQNGNSIRIVDRDGSVYTGSLQPGEQGVVYGGAQNQQALLGTEQNSPDNARRAPVPSGSTSPEQWQNVQNYYFQVDGLNRTLQQNVVFTGSLLGNLPQVGSLPQSFYRNVDQGAHLANQLMKSEAANQVEQLPWSSLRITGTAILNQTNQIQINAAPVAPAKN